jgi:cytoskeletal protein RodZ
MSETMNQLCIEKHKHIDETLQEHKEHFERLDVRMEKQENSQVRTEVVVEHLCKKIDQLISVLVGGILTIVAAMGGFIIWYIQSLPR